MEDTREKEYTQTEREQVKVLRGILEAIDREPELPGLLPKEIKNLLDVDPEHVLRMTVKATKISIRVQVQQAIDSLGTYAKA